MLCTEREFGTSRIKDSPIFRRAEIAELTKWKSFLTGPSSAPCTEAIDKLRRQSGEIADAAYFTWWKSLQATCKTSIPAVKWDWWWEKDRTKALQKGESKTWPEGRNEILAEKIDRALDRGALPGVEYQVSFLLKNSQKFVHWSSIVERKPVGDKCFYRVRDSFGTGCARYKDPKACSNGFLWVERQELLNHVDAVSSLE